MPALRYTICAGSAGHALQHRQALGQVATIGEDPRERFGARTTEPSTAM